MNIAIKNFIQITYDDDRCMIAIDQIESLSETEGKVLLNLKYQPNSCEVDQSYDQVCALIKEATTYDR